VSSRLDKLEINTKVFMKGPYGQFIPRSSEREVVFVAAGTGLAPIRAMLHDLAEKKCSVPLWLFYRFKSEADLLFYGELEALKQRLPTLKIIYSVSNPSPTWSGESMRIHECISKYIANPEKKCVYVCGPPLMVKETMPVLEKLGFDPEHMFKEAW